MAVPDMLELPHLHKYLIGSDKAEDTLARSLFPHKAFVYLMQLIG
jgi:hypothetical protein